ncbi:GspH/FimT family pseudopilin [Vreelandella jeotgali]|uniref:GspH/FimT family pseudopilin n=1 Tax=Vreelandella jeotgali TaxID=553386 RepID=UPI00034BC444|nr:GspH/FimT family pseudopilin [Halomonas jeotgali]
MQRVRGFTLIELLVTLAIAGLLATIVAPSMSTFMARARLASDVNQVVSAFNFARSEAIKRRTNVTAELQSDGDGWRIDVREKEGDDIRHVTGGGQNVSVTPAKVTYGRLGMVDSCSPCNLTVEPEDSKAGDPRTIKISKAGGLTIEDDDD